MNKLYLSSALLAIFALPAFADIDKSASTATCDSATIGATSGTAYMDTDWTANTINLDFYSDGEKISTGSCTYDGAIELPNDPEDKTGYTFGGWQLRRAPATQTTFDLSTLAQYISEPGGVRYYQIRHYSTGATECRYNASGKFATVDCSDPLVSDLSMSEWKVDFTYGTVKGIGRCSTVNGSYAQTGTPTDDWMQEGAKYCWCQVTAFDAEKDGSFLPVASSSWVFNSINGDKVSCAYACANTCADYVFDYAGFRRAVFGITQ